MAQAGVTISPSSLKDIEELSKAANQKAASQPAPQVAQPVQQPAQQPAQQAAQPKQTTNVVTPLSGDAFVEQAKYKTKYDVEYEDNFLGQTQASYAQGRLSQDSAAAWREYSKNPTAENKQKAEFIDSTLANFQNKNAATLADDATASLISQDVAGYIPQLLDQLKAGAGGAAIGAAGGAAIGSAIPVLGTAGGALWGSRAGYVAGSAKQAYDIMSGYALRELIGMGIPDDVAIKMANDEGVVSSIIEAADSIVDIATLGLGKLGKVIFKTGAKTAAEKTLTSRLLKAAAAYGFNVASEYAQEGAQEVVSIANENRAETGQTGAGNLAAAAANKATNLTGEEKARVGEAAAAGARIAAVMGGATKAVNAGLTAALGGNQTTPANVTNGSTPMVSQVIANASGALQQRDIANVILDSKTGRDYIAKTYGSEGAFRNAVQQANPTLDKVQVYLNMANEVRNYIANSTFTTKEDKKVQRDLAKLPALNMTQEQRQLLMNMSNEQTATSPDFDRFRYEGYTGEFPDTNGSVNTLRANEEFVAQNPNLTFEGTTAQERAMQQEQQRRARMTEAQLIAEDSRQQTPIRVQQTPSQTQPSVGESRNIAQTTNPITAKQTTATKPKNASQNKPKKPPVIYTHGGMDMDDQTTAQHVATLKPRTAKTLGMAAERLGVKIRFADTVRGGSANAQISQGIITIEKNNRHPLRFLFGHEITHRLKELAPDQYDALHDEVMALDPNLQQEVERTIAKYKKWDMEIERRDAEEEVVADFVGSLLEANEDYLDYFVAGISHNKTLLEKLRQIFKEFADKFRGTTYEKQADRVISKLDEAMRAASDVVKAAQKEQKAETSEKYSPHFSLKQFEGGPRFVDVEVDQAQFDNLTMREMGMLATKIIKEKFAGKIIGIDNKVFVNGRTAGEYGFTQKRLSRESHEAKMRASTELDNLLDAGTNFRTRPDGADGHIHPNITGDFRYFDTIFKVGEEYYKGVINIMPVSKGLLLKDITKIENITQDISSSYGETPKSTFLRNVSMDSIPNSAENVKHKLSLKGATLYNRTAVLEERTVEQYLKDYAAPSSPNYAQAYIARMNPADFIRLTTSRAGRSAIEQQTDELDMEQLREASFRQPIFLRIDHETGEVVGHEGRHRSQALADAGIDSIPVLLFDSSNKYGKTPIDSLVLTGQGFGSNRSMARITVENLQPLSYANKNNVLALVANQPADEQVAEKYGWQTARWSLKDEPNVRRDFGELLDIANAEQPADTSLPPIKPRPQRTGDKRSKFADSIQGASIFDDRLKELAEGNDSITSYKSITNKETMEAANNRLNEEGEKAVTRFMGMPAKSATAQDMAMGFILIYRYQAVGDYDSALEVAAKMREMGTPTAQTLQLMSILGRLTPEGMLYYARKSLDQAWEEVIKGKSKEWIAQHRDEYKLTQEEADSIVRNVIFASQMPEGRDRHVVLAGISQLLADKVQKTAGKKIKALARISMLFNPKTQVRNILGNTLVVPQLIISDFIGTAIDAGIARRTGVRTTGAFNAKALRGFKKGVYESFDDFRRHINTRNMGGDRFEIGQGSAFSKRNALGRALNSLDRTLSFALDAGDRGFYETWFINSLNNQLRLNNATEPTASMIEVATLEALQRTWQDDNAYTKTVSAIRKAFNTINFKGYGLGDVILPFIKTPANLTKALVDFSPIGLVNALTRKSIALKRALDKGELTPAMQRDYVKSVSQGITGTLMMLGYWALAASGAMTGGGDDDDDVAYFEKNIMGIAPYSVRIGNTSYTYDWAQPLGGNAAMVADIYESISSGKYKGIFKGAAGDRMKTAANIIWDAMQAGGNVLYDQSFMTGVSKLFGYDGFWGGLLNTITAEPAKFTPTVVGQIASIGDSTARTSYVYGDPVQTAINKVRYKLPALRNSLEPIVDQLGREMSNKNNPAYVFFSPALVYSQNGSEAANEMYRVYKETGEKSAIVPRPPRYFQYNDTKKIMTPAEYTKYSKVLGQTSAEQVVNLLDDAKYAAMDASEQADILTKIFAYASAKAKSAVADDYVMPDAQKKAAEAEKAGISVPTYLLYNMVTGELTADKDKNGKSISGSKKEKVLKVIDATGENDDEKDWLYLQEGYSDKTLSQAPWHLDD